MDEKRYRYRVERLVLAGAALLLILLITAWIREGFHKEWRTFQREYETILGEVEGSDGTSAGMEKGIFQVELPQFKRVDRCISCHHGIEDMRMAERPLPHATHPGSYLADHPVSDYGCTICHGGQGRALSREEAFGRLPDTHWPYPLMEQPYIQASCGQCHLAIFDDPQKDGLPIIEGMEVFVRGKTLFSGEGCLGCHKARDVGGILGPDLTRQGEKTRHDYSFQNIAGAQTVSNWLKEHFKDPEMVSPGSQMLRINLDEQELEALAIFVMGLSKPEIPFDYFTMPTLNEFKGIRDSIHGADGYATLCSACHGKQGEGKGYEQYKTGIPSIGNVDFVRVASEDFIRFTMEKGRSLRQMGSWAPMVSGMKTGELDEIALHMKGPYGEPDEAMHARLQGDAKKGAALFDRHCSVCHGGNGTGGVAVALNQEGFLERATDEMIQKTMLQGRGNTAMPGWAHLEPQVRMNLLTLIRSWSGTRPAEGEIDLPKPNLEEGAMRYHFLCSRCHGEFGEGETGPAIINRDLLEAAGTGFLYKTIAEGRKHTAMFGWSLDVYNQEKLDAGEISNIIGFMKEQSTHPLTYIYPGSNPGDRDAGKEIFRQRCAECHGLSGEGIKGPALNNQELLSAASNGYLMATMTLGRGGTGMPSWGYGEGEHPALSGKERQDLVAFIRTWQRIRIKY